MSDKDNIFVLMFVKKDTDNTDLTKINDDYLTKSRKIANDLAPQIENEKIKFVYFAEVNMDVPENKNLTTRFKLKDDSADLYPVGAVVGGQKGWEFEGPAVVTILDRDLRLAGGLPPKYDDGAPKDADNAAGGAGTTGDNTGTGGGTDNTGTDTGSGTR